jgi:hypothetical protein
MGCSTGTGLAPTLRVALPAWSSLLPRAVAAAAGRGSATVAECTSLTSAGLAAPFAVEAGERAVATAVAGAADRCQGDSGGGHEGEGSEDDVPAFEGA